MVPVAFSVLSYGSTPVDSTTWVEIPLYQPPSNTTLSTGLPAMVSSVALCDTGSQTMELGIGATALTVGAILIYPPGGYPDLIPLIVSTGNKVWVRAIGTTAAEGSLVITYFHGRL